MSIPTNKSIKSVSSNGVNIPLYGTIPATITAGDTPVKITTLRVEATRASSPQQTALSLTVNRSGTYRFKTVANNAYSSSTSLTYNSMVQFYKNGVAIGTARTLEGNEALVYSQDIACDVGDVITVYASSANSSYYTTVTDLVACIDWDIAF